MTSGEKHLLKFLSEEDESQYGECYGPDLDRLIALGLAEVMGEETETQNNFIAKGKGIMYRAVRLTEAGWKRVKELRNE